MAGIKFAFKVLAVAGNPETEHPETESHEDIAFYRDVLPGRVRYR
jgi:hypothetical protein